MAEPMRVLLVADEPLDAKADGSKQRSLMATLPAAVFETVLTVLGTVLKL